VTPWPIAVQLEIIEDTKYIIQGVILLQLVNARAGANITNFDKNEYLEKLPAPFT